MRKPLPSGSHPSRLADRVTGLLRLRGELRQEFIGACFSLTILNRREARALRTSTHLSGKARNKDAKFQQHSAFNRHANARLEPRCSMVTLPPILELLNARKNRTLLLAQAALSESQFRAFKTLFLDEFGQKGLESELAREALNKSILRTPLLVWP